MTINQSALRTQRDAESLCALSAAASAWVLDRLQREDELTALPLRL
jgi:hypothetical protein